MAIVVLMDFPGGTTEMYDQVTARLNLGGRTPQGNLFHSAGLFEGNLRVVDAWESEEAFKAFSASMQSLTQGIDAPQPMVTVWPAYNILPPNGE